MTEKLKHFLKSQADFDEQQLDKIVAHFRPKSIKRNNILLKEGEVCKEFYFIHTGCIRIYFVDREGFEKTRSVLLDGDIGTALTSFISQKPSIEFIDALENTELLTISHKDFYQLNNEMAPWKEFYQKFMEMAYLNQSRKIEALMTLNAKQRFQKLLKGNPVLIQRLSNKVLASFLDMREETLSRIKSK